MVDDLVLQPVDLPRGEIRILQPADAAELPDSGAIEWAPLVPYWSVLWRSGLALAREVDGIPLSGKRVLELGCGLGLPSLVAARAGAEVVATDDSAEALELVARNADLNGIAIETAELSWGRNGDTPDGAPYDLVLASDVLYESALVEALLELLPRLAPTVWVADPGRPAADAFLEGASEAWSVTTTIHGVIRIHRLEAR